MKASTLILAAAVLFAASPADAGPTYRQQVVDVFKQVCLPAGTNPAAVGIAAAKLGWKPAPASIKAFYPGPQTKVWVSPATSRFYLAQSPNIGICQVGYYDGQETKEPMTNPAAFSNKLRYIMIHAGIAVGSGFVKTDENEELLQQGYYISPNYPGLKMTVGVTNFPNAPNFFLHTSTP
ncbi:hypothetical protein [Caulobacter sp. LARHSG274]